MRKTEAYRKHHEEIRALASRIESMLDAAAIQADPAQIAAVLRDLFGKFSVHLALEDNSLYPRYTVHADLAVADAARRFQVEMGGLGENFDTYKRNWPGPMAIARDPAAFVRDSRAMLGLLKTRVAREEDQLYDLIDRAA
jgi:hypothetical protein